MEVYAVSGKGGVGKSLVSCALAISLAGMEEGVAILDCDKKGQAIARTLSTRGRISPVPGDFFEVGVDNLVGGAIAPHSFFPIVPGKRSQGEFDEYMSQFPGSMGLVAYQDMLRNFFAAFTQPEAASELIGLSELLRKAKQSRVEKLVLDLEPTKGAASLISSTKAVAESLGRLANQGKFIRMLLGQGMPDVRRFLDSSYFEDVGDYAERLVDCAETLTSAKYILVTGPKVEMVDEMFRDTEPAVKALGGQVELYVVNDILRGLGKRERASQQRQIARVEDCALKSGTPLFQIGHHIAFAVDNAIDSERYGVLTTVGGGLIANLG